LRIGRDMTWWILMGLTGVTLVLTGGSIFDGLRGWLAGFTHPANVLRWLGELLACPMCAVAWVGMMWGICTHQPWPDVFAYGGLVSLSATTIDVLQDALMSAVVLIPNPDQRAQALRQLLESRGIHVPSELVEDAPVDDEDDDEAEE